MFAKIFTQIFESSIASDHEVRHVFEDLLLLANIDGIVDIPHDAIARRTNVPIEIVRRTIGVLESPDPQSRSPEEEGRRIVRLPGTREWGWKIVNYQKYRDMRTEANHRAFVSPGVATGYVYFLSREDSADAPVKIGFSTNPWARSKEASSEAAGTQAVIGMLPGSQDTKTTWHQRFISDRLRGDWFKRTDELMDAIASETTTENGVVLRSAMQRQRQRQRQKEKQKDLKAVQTPLLECENEAPKGPSKEELIYAAYPRKTDKPAALKAIEKALKKKPFEDLLRLTTEYARVRSTQNPGFTPYPATFFNGERYNDDPSTWPDASSTTNGNGRPPGKSWEPENDEAIVIKRLN